MAASLTASRRARSERGTLSSFGTLLVFLLPLGAGYVIARGLRATVAGRDFPWVTGRALGIAGYIALSALVASGVWMRHPWRHRLRRGHAETLLRVHSSLGVGTVLLVAGHIVALATDSYARVGWAGAFVPGMSQYRTTAVALGAVAFELLVAVGVTARLAGRRGTTHWLAVHRLATATFALAWFHGVLTGSDTPGLRPLYVLTGGFVVVLVVTRALARPAEARRQGPAVVPVAEGPPLIGAER